MTQTEIIESVVRLIETKTRAELSGTLPKETSSLIDEKINSLLKSIH